MNPVRLPLSPIAVIKLRRALLAWYDVHRRDLPWRRDPKPYRVWVSEIMLQQTRVAAVLEHYARFMKKFPSVNELAAAREADVLAAWSGLGYYHRARRVHQAARQIVGERGGKFPGTAAEWLELAGIGRYTAAAIASIAFGESVAVVDGNVERVLERLLGREGGREAAWQRAELLLDRERPGDFNQAVMELGATVCTPKSPHCLTCPLFAWCKSRGALEAVPPAPRKRKHLAYAVIRCGKGVRLVQRPVDATLMAGMWELPSLDREQTRGHRPIAHLRHSITDTDYQVEVYELPAEDPPHGRWVTRRRLDALPLTGLTRTILRALEPESDRPRRKSK
jgi:A/G-specific adenine glycosylase